MQFPRIPQTMNHAAARLNMIESQLRTNKVYDQRVLQAFLDVPREIFVDEGRRPFAYIDEDVPLGEGRFLMEPMVLGRLLQVANPRADEKALEVASGTGYAAALLARLVRKVVGLESNTAFAARANANLRSLGAGNAKVREGALGAGCADEAPFGLILVSGAVSEIPPALLDQLAEGGRLVAVVRPPAAVGQAVLIERADGVLSRRTVFDAGTPLLPELVRAPSFVF
jgi:protein-L-isoaspartate(D-aspartate) O-methyltransferase